MGWSWPALTFDLTAGVTVLLTLLLAPVTSIKNQKFIISDQDCLSSQPINIIDGAVIISQTSRLYSQSNLHCSIAFKTPSPGMKMLIHFKMMDISKPASNSQCSDWVTLFSYNSPSSHAYLLHHFCGGLQDLPEELTYVSGYYVNLTWHTGRSVNGTHRGFVLTMTAVRQKTELCLPNEFRCANRDCISSDLVCDLYTNCLGSDDERYCPRYHEDSTTVLDPSLAPPTLPTTKEVYLWMPLIVVVLFTTVLVILILVGRRSTNGRSGVRRHRESGKILHGAHDKLSLIKRDLDYASSHENDYFTTDVFEPSSEPALGEIPSTLARTSTASATLTTSTAVMTTKTTISPSAVAPNLNITISLSFLGVFLFFLFVFVITGCRERRASQQHDLEQNANSTRGDSAGDTERLSPNFNPAYMDSDSVFLEPSTPPPSYTSMERQISYVSQISMASDQISIPPTYEDAEEYPTIEGANPADRSVSRRASRQHSRNSSGGSRAPPPAPSSGSRHNSASVPTFRLLSSSSINSPTNSPIEPLPEYSSDTVFEPTVTVHNDANAST